MDVLANIDLETFKILTWVLAVVIGGLWFYISSPKMYWEVVTATTQALLAAAVTSFLLNFGVAAYIFDHLIDPRWSAGKDPLLTANEIQSSLPVIGEIVKALNDAQNQVVGAVNNVGQMQNSLNVAGEFLVIAGKSIVVAIIFALILLYVVKKWAPRRKAKFENEQRRLEKEAEIKWQAELASDNAYRDKQLDVLFEHAGIDPPIRHGRVV